VHRVRFCLILSSAAIVSACSHGETEAPMPQAPPTKADRAYTYMLPWVDEALAQGPAYGLSELQWMDRANRLGEEGKIASALFDDERKRHFRKRRGRILADLRTELGRMPDANLDDLLAVTRPHEAGDAELHLNNPHMKNWSLYWMEALHAALRATSCAAMATTPRAWARLYPDREPFAFERFKGSRAWLRYSYCPKQRRPRSPPP
jgi:hypothetical protein